MLGDVIAPLYFCLARDYVTELELSAPHSSAWHTHGGRRARAVSRNRSSTVIESKDGRHLGLDAVS